MSQPLRFVHASDFHLERPLAGLSDPPAHLVDLLIDAPYAAAERIFELTLSERADFLVLAGDIVNVERAGPRALAFLMHQFQRLAAREIAVYWLAGDAERRSPWPGEIKLPPNVQFFPRGTAKPLVHHADGDDLAVLVGYSALGHDARLESFAKSKGGRFTIGVLHAKSPGRQLAKLGIDYWVCGGPHRRRQQGDGRNMAVCSGSPQGRSPAERGAHGAMIVEVDEHGTARPRFVATDMARYRRLRVALDQRLPRAEQERVLADAVHAVAAKSPGLDLFLRWQLVPTGAPLIGSRESWAASWLRWLRQEFGTDSPAAWSIDVDVKLPADKKRSKRESQADGSLLADFFTAVDEFASSDEALPLADLLPEELRDTASADLVQSIDAPQRRRLLEQTRWLGRDLLGAEEDSA